MTDTKTLNSNRYRELRTKVLLTFFLVSSLLIGTLTYYHYTQRTKILYEVSIEKLLILTKTIRNIEKNQNKLYNARYKKVQHNTKLLKAIQNHNINTIKQEAHSIFSFFKEASPALLNIHIYDATGNPLIHSYSLKISKKNSVLQEAINQKKRIKGFVVTPDGYYTTLIYPLNYHKDIIGYLEFELKADNLFRLSSKAGRYKYALYLRDANDTQSVGKLVATNSKMFKNLTINTTFLYNYANANKLFKYNGKYFLLQQYDIETPFQKNFAQVIIAYDATKYVTANKRMSLYSLELSMTILLLLLLVIYLFTTKLINKLELEEREIAQRHKQIEIIMNTSDNLIILLSHGKILLMNEAFLPFTSFEKVEEIIEKQFNISKIFVKTEHTFYTKNAHSNLEWIQELNKYKDANKIVALEHKKFGITYFNVKIKIPKDADNSYVIIFSNISSLYKKSLQDEYMAYHDTLTQIYNREFFNEAIAQNIYTIEKSAQPATLLMLDLDFFKKVNDTYGHQVGDDVPDFLIFPKNGIF